MAARVYLPRGQGVLLLAKVLLARTRTACARRLALVQFGALGYAVVGGWPCNSNPTSWGLRSRTLVAVRLRPFGLL